MMRTFDQLFEHSTRSLAQRTSRRSLLASLGQLLTGAALLPLLPVDRASRASAAEAKPTCANCDCNRNEREKPVYRPSRNNDLNWCMANADVNYHCTVSVILGVAEK